MKFIVLMLISTLAWAQTTQRVVIDGVEKNGFKIVAVELMSTSSFACANDVRVFSDDDFDRDGTLDDFCVGVVYDPCDIHTLQIAIIRQAMSGGNGCESLDDIERRRRRQEACDSGFSPQPDFCI